MYRESWISVGRTLMPPCYQMIYYPRGLRISARRRASLGPSKHGILDPLSKIWEANQALENNRTRTVKRAFDWTA